MPPRRSLITVAVLAAALATPAGALAQSAGDDQYTDPFGADEPATPQSPPQQPSTPPAAGGDATAGTADSGSPASASEAPAGESAATLPATGLPALGLGAAGLVLLLGGAGLRRLA